MEKCYRLSDLEEKKQMEKYIELLKNMDDEEQEEEKPHRLIAQKIFEELFVKAKKSS